MSYGLSSKWEEKTVDASKSQPPRPNVSVMRAFLESDPDFEWPKHLGKCSGNHCDISQPAGPLKWKKKISDKRNASIDMYEAGPGFTFQKPFVVKTIRGTNPQKVRNMTANEVNNMRDLRHPHISALLGTFDYQERLSILIFPAACCDLHQFMKQLSKDLQKFQEQSDRSHSLYRGASPSFCSSTQDSTTTHTQHPHDPDLVTRKQATNENHDDKPKSWPLLLPLERKLELLRRYFVCLCEALSYLHESGVRHKDIKPGNILIDESGSVILTDFGISRRFPKNTPHATNDEWEFTRKYASPEMMKDRNALRDDPSDIFSLGCVFLEMATLLLGNNLNNLSDHYVTIINDSGKEVAYHCNLDKVYSWIDHLRASRGFKTVQEHMLPGEINKLDNFHPSPDNYMTAALVDIRKMLDETPSNRPVSTGLWQRFQHVSAIKCGDCDPRRPVDIWKPSDRQKKDAQTGLNNRRSLHAIEEKNNRSNEASLSGDIDSPNFSPRLIPNRSLRESRRGSSPSTSQQRHSRHGHIRTRSAESPALQLNGDIRGTKSVISPSAVPKTEAVPEETNPGIAQASAITSPANVYHESFKHIRRQVSNDAGSAQPSLSTDQQATNPDLSHQRAIRQDQQSRAPNQRPITREDEFASGVKKCTPPPQTRIVVFDRSRTKAFETDFASLKGA